ncbi:PASTA domain-containing protein [Caviibacter abscessus]|uniref:PASTA domain-containing protein n=1 Tax=Caviibacter abscessus TaxID=1766719 RepID=UPI000836E46B|nr:PASTA domain-containing protein [Caviibacter abscessus]
MKKVYILNTVLAILIIIFARAYILDTFFYNGLVKVPDVTNLNKKEAAKILKKAYLNYTFISSKSNDVPLDIVYSQKPASGHIVRAGRDIRLLVNDNNGQQIPDIINLPLAQAMNVLEKANIKVKRVDYISDGKDSEQVLAVYPKQNTRLSFNQSVTLLVSSKQLLSPNIMPNIIGLDVNEANLVLSQIGLKINDITRTPDSSYPINTIVSSYPKADEPINADTVINVVISEPANNAIKEEKIKQESIDEIIKEALKDGGESN